MSSSTLYREGDDLDTLLADLDAEWPGRVRVLSIDQARVGGRFGLFGKSRIAVHFEVDGLDELGADAAEPSSIDALFSDDPLEGLLARAEAAEELTPAAPAAGASRHLRGAGDGGAELLSGTAAAALGLGGSSSSNADFAAMLLAMAESKAAARSASNAHPAPDKVVTDRVATDRVATDRVATDRVATDRVATDRVATDRVATDKLATDILSLPRASETAVPPHPPVAPAATDPLLALRRRLAEIGVPIDWVPSTVGDARGAVREVLRHLPTAPPPPSAAGEILAIVGPLNPALRAAEAVRARLGLDAQWVWRAARDVESAGVCGERTVLTDPWSAAAVAGCHRLGSTAPAVVVVATDDDLPADPAVSQILAALRPDATWRVADATRKPADSRSQAVDQTVAALVVTGAGVSASPATVFGLDRPISVVDGEMATAARWEALLLSALAAQEA